MKFVNKHIERKVQCEVAKQCKSAAKKFWKYVNSKSKSQSRIGDVKTVGADGGASIVNDDGDRANIFGYYFSGVITHESQEEFNELSHRCPAFPCDHVSFNDELVLDKRKSTNHQAVVCYILIFYDK